MIHVSIKSFFSSCVQKLLSLPFFLISYINNVHVSNIQLFCNSCVYKRLADILCALHIFVKTIIEFIQFFLLSRYLFHLTVDSILSKQYYSSQYSKTLLQIEK